MKSLDLSLSFSRSSLSLQVAGDVSESDEIKLWCWALGDTHYRIFEVSIKRSAGIYGLKITIKERKPSFKDIAADSLNLSKVDKWY